MFRWKDYPELDQQLLDGVEEALKGGRSKASWFREFAALVSTKVGTPVTDKACEVRHLRLTGHIPSRVREEQREEGGRSPLSGDWKEGAINKVARLINAGSTVMAACEQVGEEVERKPRTIQNAYWEWKRERATPGKGQVVAPTTTPPVNMATMGHDRKEEDLLLEAIGKLCEYGPKIGEFDLAAFANGLNALVRSAVLPVAVSQEQIRTLQEQVAYLEQQLDRAQEAEALLRKENSALRTETKEVRREYARHFKEMVERWQEVEEVCNVHLSQSLGEKVSYMRPFGERLRHTVDRFGVVIASTPEVLREG